MANYKAVFIGTGMIGDSALEPTHCSMILMLRYLSEEQIQN